MKLMSNLLAGIAMLLPTLVQAQSFSESALLFSRIKPAGSARIMGMGACKPAWVAITVRLSQTRPG